ncbi:MAG TPA: hypothetical protein VK828_08855 [Terriglobales bacterium]|nr:hypothetical protein [Terriglobales bacterium]
MRRIAIFVMLGASFANARDHQAPQSGTLLQMDSVQCGTEQKGDKSLAGEIIGTDNTHQKMHTLLCQEYLLQADHLVYRIRPKDDKHPALLPVGAKAQFRIEKDYLKLRVEDLGDKGKEREYIVVSMTPRTEVQTADNHQTDNHK